MKSNAATKWVPTYCFNCVAGPDLLMVKVENGIATEIGPNFSGRGIHPGDGKPCVKAYGLIQATPPLVHLMSELESQVRTCAGLQQIAHGWTRPALLLQHLRKVRIYKHRFSCSNISMLRKG